MNPSLLAVALAYAFLLFVLVLVLLNTGIGAGRKLVLVVLSAGFYLWHYEALQNYLGWPAGNALPQRFEMVSSVIVEPDARRDDPGGIYLWVVDLDSEQPVPRAHRLPYHKELHREVDDTLRKQRAGQRHVGSPVAGSGGNHSGIEFEAVQRARKRYKPTTPD